ncbi:alpha/beta fold hydrolase [Sphingomonas sp. MA1305]|nr:alpha/beta fold hydrolase [Sphingomonas sp. MA1305]
MFAAALAAAVTSTDISAKGPQGPLKGTFVDAGKGRPVVLILPGSGPTDRDGNNPMGIKAAPYRLLAEGLAAAGISSVRIDKRGLFASAGAVPDGNAVTLADYVTDTGAWVAATRARTGAPCVWLLGHSEGGLVALAAASAPTAGVCGLVLVATPGRPLGVVMREQLHANPGNAPLLPAADAAIDALSAGQHVDVTTLPAPLQPLFRANVQGFLISLFAADPVRMAAAIRLPMLIVQGERDIQVGRADATALKAAAPGATLAMLPNVNHVLKLVESDSRGANLATYADPNVPLAPAVVSTVVGFISEKRR